MTTYIPFGETLAGSDLTGSSGDTGRIFTLANSGAIAAQMQVLVSEAIQQITENFTFDSSANTVTFIGPVWDDQPIQIDYFTASSDPVPSGSYYADTLQIVRFSGIGVAVELENLGTGDAANKSFDTKHGNIIADSYSVYYGPTGNTSNLLTEMTEGTHYQIFKDDGRVVILAAGLVVLGTDELYISYTYSPKQSDTVLTTYLPKAQAEVDKKTGNYWGSVKTSIEYLDGYDSGYPQTDEPYGTQIESYPEFELFNKSVQTITSILFLDREGNTDTTLETTQYRIVTDNELQESRVLINTSIPNGKANIKITYTHGYTTPPELIQELTALTAGMMALVNISGGSYKDVSGYTIGRKNFQIGQIYINIKESINQMKSRIDAITEDVGYRFDFA